MFNMVEIIFFYKFILVKWDQKKFQKVISGNF